MKLNVLIVALALGILGILIFGKQADAYCYDSYLAAKTGKISYLHYQKINGIDCFTGRFEPPRHLAKTESDYWNFDMFRLLFLGTILWLVLNVFLFYKKKQGWAAIVALLAFVNCVVCAIYFDGFHNYYASAADSFHQKGIASLTFNIEYYWLLSNLLFWVLFGVFLLLQILQFVLKRIDSKVKKDSTLLDS